MTDYGDLSLQTVNVTHGTIAAEGGITCTWYKSSRVVVVNIIGNATKEMITGTVLTSSLPKSAAGSYTLRGVIQIGDSSGVILLTERSLIVGNTITSGAQVSGHFTYIEAEDD